VGVIDGGVQKEVSPLKSLQVGLFVDGGKEYQPAGIYTLKKKSKPRLLVLSLLSPLLFLPSPLSSSLPLTSPLSRKL
jgi:hypothetical protein